VQTHLDDVVGFKVMVIAFYENLLFKDKLEKKILETTEKLKQRLGNVSTDALPCSKEELDVFNELVQV